MGIAYLASVSHDQDLETNLFFPHTEVPQHLEKFASQRNLREFRKSGKVPGKTGHTPSTNVKKNVCVYFVFQGILITFLKKKKKKKKNVFSIDSPPGYWKLLVVDKNNN